MSRDPPDGPRLPRAARRGAHAGLRGQEQSREARRLPQAGQAAAFQRPLQTLQVCVHYHQ